MTYGLAIIAINLGYLLFSVIAGIVLAKFLKKTPLFQKRSTALMSVVLFLLIFFAPFYDLLIQKGIKTYYQTFDKTYAKIYAYPEKDSEGRVESVAENRWFDTLSFDYINKNSKDFIRMYKWVKDFTENYFDGNIDENRTNDLGYARVYLNKNPISYETIKSPNEFKARYQVLTQVNEHWFYKEMVTSFWDKKTDKLLAETLEVIFPVKNQKNKFRYKYLHQHGANGGGGIFIEDINGLRNNVYFKLFINKNSKMKLKNDYR